MLDKSLIGEEPKNLKLKCELCGRYFDIDNEDEFCDCDSIDECGRCIDCDNEYSDQYPDRV